MSYSTIASALQTRLNAISGLDNVYTYERISYDALQSSEFQNLFKDSSSSVLNTWWITCNNIQTVQSTEDYFTVDKYAITLHGFYTLNDSLQTPLTFKTLCESVASNLRSGDRTLGGIVLCYELPSSEFEFATLGRRKGDLNHAYIRIECHQSIDRRA